MVKVVCDLMGADNKPHDLIKGVIDAINLNPDVFCYVCCPYDDVKDVLDNLSYNKNQIEIIDCNEEITNYDIPTKAFREKKNSSLVRGLTLTKENDDISAFLSCGSTGAVLVSSVFILKTVTHLRPALSPIIAGKKKFCIVDCGANVDCRVDQLLDFAKMGVAYMEALGINNPKVSLLSNGHEEKKGNDVIKETHQELKRIMPNNFIGNIEGKNILYSDSDVVVCDGLMGNIALKTIEGTAGVISNEILEMSKELDSDTQKKILKMLLNLRNKFDYNTKGGAVLLGVNKIVIKAHGAGVAETFTSIINQAYELTKGDLIGKIKKYLGEE